MAKYIEGLLVCIIDEAFCEVINLIEAGEWTLNDEDLCEIIDELKSAGMINISRIQGTNKYNNASILPDGDEVYRVIHSIDMQDELISLLSRKGVEQSVANVCELALAVARKYPC